MADDVRLAISLFVPDDEPPAGGWAALIEALPYRKDDLTAGYRSEYARLADEGQFAVCRVDLRGTGSSTGVATDEYPPVELDDINTVIAWLAAQPWSNGRVGMYGTSYSGFNSLQVACTRPPALKAICAIYATDDRYTDDVHYTGGVLRAIDLIDYVAYMTPMNALPPAPAVFGERWRDEWLARVEATPVWALRWLREQTDGPYWRHGSLRPDYGRITAATLHVGGWADGYRNAPLRSAAAMTCPTEVLFGPWAHASAESSLPGPHLDLVPELIDWFDRWLRPTAAHGSHEQRTRVFMRRPCAPAADLAEHAGEWWEFRGPPEVTQVGLRLDSAEPASLAVRPDTGASAWISCAGQLPWGQPTDQRGDDAWSWCNEWALADGAALLGNPMLHVRVAADQPVATLVAKLSDLHPDGTSQLISRGALNLTHRMSSESPSPVVPGEPMDASVELEATSWIIEPGHRLRLAITGADWPNLWPTPSAVTLTMWPSTLTLSLPTVGHPGTPAPQFRPPTGINPHGADEHGEQPSTLWRFEHDVLARTTVARVDHGSVYGAERGARVREHYAGEVGVSIDSPGDSWARASIDFELTWPEAACASHLDFNLRSTSDTYDVELRLTVRENDELLAERAWQESIPRHLQ
jgi:uncharacterized protein